MSESDEMLRDKKEDLGHRIPSQKILSDPIKNNDCISKIGQKVEFIHIQAELLIEGYAFCPAP